MVELLPLVRTIQIHNLEEIENVLTIHSFYIQPTAVNNLYRLINDNLSLVELIQTNLSTKPFLFTYFLEVGESLPPPFIHEHLIYFLGISPNMEIILVLLGT